MDPDKTLRELRLGIEMCRNVDPNNDPGLWAATAEDVFDRTAALDDWIRRGGALPAAWQPAHS